MICLTNIELRRGTRLLLKDAELVVHPGQHIGVIGANGCGKSSLFKLLLGQVTADGGDLSIPAGWRIAYMAQELASSERCAVDFVMDGDVALRSTEAAIERAMEQQDNSCLARQYEKMEAIDGFDAHYRAEQLLHGLGFCQSDIDRPVRHFSGGWRIRLNLAQTLMSPADLLLLDEPSNHLDLDATLWLEQWLRSYQGTLLMISHDRDFIDNVVERIVHIERQKTISYKGNYSTFEQVRGEHLALQQASFDKQQKRRKEVEAFVARFRYKASKARQAQSRLKELERMGNRVPAHVDSPFHFHFAKSEAVHSALVTISQATLGYADKNILSQVNFDLQPGSRIGLLGPNGAGKSTLIDSLAGNLGLLQGHRTYGAKVKIGYFAQHQLDVLDLQSSPLLHLRRMSPAATDQQLRDFLAGFNFHADRVLEPIEDFSGGEKARLVLAAIVWQQPNLLLLDEPTNHLDLEMRQALTMALQSYGGALLVISHDRHLLRNTVDELYLVADGEVKEFNGDLNDYQNWLKEFSRQKVQVAPSTDKVDKKQLRRDLAEQRKKLAPLNKKINNIENKIDQLQQQLSSIESELAEPDIYHRDNHLKLKQSMLDQAEVKKNISAAEQQWLDYQQQLENTAG